MPFSGTFDVLDFTEVLRLLARQQLTGRLHVRSRSYGANLFVEEGQLVGADQSEHQAAATVGDVHGRVEEICFELLDTERGSFEFHPGRPGPVPATTRLKVEAVVTRARKRLEEWRELQALIPSLDLQPRLVVDLERSEVTIDRERWRLLTAVDGRRNLRAIGRALNVSDFDVCRVTRILLDDGVLELDGRAAAIAQASLATDTEPPVTETVTTATGKQAIVSAAPTPGADAPGGGIGVDAPADPPLRLVTASTSPGTGDPAAQASPPPDRATDPTPPTPDTRDPDDDEGGARRRRVVRIRSRIPKPDSD